MWWDAVVFALNVVFSAVPGAVPAPAPLPVANECVVIERRVECPGPAAPTRDTRGSEARSAGGE